MPEVQKFKGDALELKMIACAEPALSITGAALDDFYQGAYDADDFILGLYDAGRMPFSQRIGRDVFISFIKKALANFPTIGTFDSYLFILWEIFGTESEITFTVPAPGKLEIAVNAISDTTFESLVRELTPGSGGTSYSYDLFTLSTMDGYDIAFRGISGIETEYELNLLFAEIIPAGIVPTISLEFFSKYVFITFEDDPSEMITHLGDEIVFIEIGG